MNRRLNCHDCEGQPRERRQAKRIGVRHKVRTSLRKTRNGYTYAAPAVLAGMALYVLWVKLH
jgi:hypothetical protein